MWTTWHPKRQNHKAKKNETVSDTAELIVNPQKLQKMRIRRARALLLLWQGPTLVLMNYQTRIQATASPEAFRVLHLLPDWIRISELFQALPEFSRKSILNGVSELVKNTFVVCEGTLEAKRDEELAKVWGEWLPQGSFHFATKDANYVRPQQAARLYSRYLTQSRQPPLLKTYSRVQRVQLPGEQKMEGEFWRVLMARRTQRDYAGRDISLRTLSTLLYCTWGVTGRIDAPPFGKLFLKTSPSGGALHPGEVYVLALRVKGLGQGLYHYDGLHHRLERLKNLRARRKASEYTADQDFLEDASALFLMTAVFPRTQWKYRFARAYRVVLLETGHLCQTFCLVATWLGLAPFCTAALRDTLIEKDLGLDGIRESILYVAGVGVPVDGKLRNSR